jgi:hypothetical protein
MRKIVFICSIALLLLIARPAHSQAADSGKLIEQLRENIRTDQRELCIRRAMDHTKPLDMDEWRDEPMRTGRQPVFIVKSVRVPFAGVPLLGFMGGNSFYVEGGLRF